jgi:hypothetical protein
MSEMMDDINKYAAIWDAAQSKGIFKKDPAEKAIEDENLEADTDFFGQYLSDDYDMDRPLNEVDSKYWAEVSRLAGQGQHYSINEAESEKKDIADTLAKSHNPVYPNTVGKDQDVNITQNWGVGGKEHFQLEDLKVRLEKLEGKLNALESVGKSGKDAQGQIDSIKKQIDDLSNSLDGERFSNDG